MNDFFDIWKKASFGGIEFPWTDLDIKGSLRHHTHEYLKRPGGEVEPLGRRCYVFTFKCKFVDVFESYADLYPTRLSALISLFESEKTYDLWVPPMERSFRAKGTEWTRSITAMMRNGEDVSFSLTEDNSEQYTTLNLIGTRSSALAPKSVVLAQEVRALDDAYAADVLDQLLATIDAWLTAVSLAQSEADYQTARVDGVVQRCTALANVPVMQTAPAAPALRALLDVWAIAATEKAQALSAERPLLQYVTPWPVMTVLDVAVSLYGTPAKAAELLRLNDFDNAMALRQATVVRYLQ